VTDPANDLRKFTIRLVRPVFQIVDMEVEATSAAQAVAAASREAAELGDDDWFEDPGLNENTAARDVLCVVDHREVAGVAQGLDEGQQAADQEPSEIGELVLQTLNETLDARRYLLLYADVEEVEGGIVRARWLEEIGEGLELADLTEDWAAQIERLHQAGARGFWDQIDNHAQDAGKEPPSSDDPRCRSSHVARGRTDEQRLERRYKSA
jgi:hypothetical protein